MRATGHTILLTVITLLLAAPASALATQPPTLPLNDGTPCTAGEPPTGDAPTIKRRSDAPEVPLDGRVIVSPVVIETTSALAPDTVMTCAITIRNRHGERATFELIPFGIVGARDASVEYLDPADPAAASTAGPWLHPVVDSVSIPPRGVATVPVVVRAPSTLPPGGAYGAINVVSRADDAAANDTNLGIETHVSVPFLLQTDGEQDARLTLRNVDAPQVRWNRDPWTLTARAENTGSVHVTARGTVRVRSIFGNEVARIRVSSRPLLPGASAPIAATWRRVPWIGLYRTELTLTAAHSKDAVATPVRGWLLVLPPWWVIAIVGALLAMMIRRGVVRRRREREQDYLLADDDAADDDDFLADLDARSDD